MKGQIDAGNNLFIWIVIHTSVELLTLLTTAMRETIDLPQQF
jgi:hypothetical protein